MYKFHIKSWGCQLNWADSEKMSQFLQENGLKKARSMKNVDFLILNTCCVRQKAEDKVAGLGRTIKAAKRRNPKLQVILTGCMAQRVRRDCKEETYDTKYLRAMKRRLSWVDHFVEIGNYEKLAELCGVEAPAGDYLDLVPDRDSQIEAYVPISKGCDNFCTYCIVPFTRGKERSRDFKAVHKEVEFLAKSKYRLITLLGQNVNSWKGEYRKKEVGFPFLLDKLVQIRGKFWLTFLTSHPKDFTNELVDVMASSKKICPYINLPIQSGSSSVLERMNRKYSWIDYIEKVEYLREKIPEVRISTDIIVGFPGETEDDFADTVALVKKIGFDMIYISEYSAREGTAGYKLKDDVTPAEKKRRKKKLDSVLREMMDEKNKESIGEKVEVLLLEKAFGKTKDLREVRVKGGKKRDIGTFVKARVINGNAGGLEVKIEV